jgi:integrase
MDDLTGARTGETLGATWNENRRNHREWTIPGSRMKMLSDHCVRTRGIRRASARNQKSPLNGARGRMKG